MCQVLVLTRVSGLGDVGRQVYYLPLKTQNRCQKEKPRVAAARTFPHPHLILVYIAVVGEWI